MKKFLFPLMLALVAALALFGAVMAQEATPYTPTDDEVNAIAKQLYCPVCENISLDVCPTQACTQWRALIREKLAQGQSEQQIKDYFVEQYGVRVLATPPARGLNWLVYIIPPLAILAGVIILFRVLRSWRKPLAEESASAAAPAGDEYVQRMEDELRKR